MPGSYALNGVDWRKADSGSPSTWFVSIPQVGMRATTVRFGDDLWAMLERESQGLGISAAQFVREATILRLAMLAGARGDSQAEATIAEVAARATRGGGDSRLARALVDPERLVALHHAGIVDTPREESFDRIASLAARVLNAPVALVSAIDRDRQFFKSCLGLPEPWASRRESPLTHSFCQHVVAAREPLVVSDARQEPKLRNNLAIRDFGVIAYLGVPLITRDGHALGTLCVIDHKPRTWTSDQVDLLKDLATSVVTEITLRSAPDGSPASKPRRNSRV
jgi:GAF domain-containing protein